MTDKVSLHQYGNSFQAKLIASLLTNRQFLEQIQDILEPKFFESDSNTWLVKEIKKYFVKYKKLPTLDALKVIIDSDTEDILKVSIIEDLKNAFKHFEATDLEFVQEKTLDFCFGGLGFFLNDHCIFCFCFCICFCFSFCFNGYVWLWTCVDGRRAPFST